jgi:asparagine synthase (glutamine-hydrolysing)
MCGIVGKFSNGVTEREMDLMLSMITHRGPDEFGTYVDKHIGMGTARLSIIDLANGQQPMRHDETGVVIVFNGEVFNYPELREPLVQEGYVFHTHSDTEVILNLYLKHGESFPTLLNGQFAVAIWDPRVEKLILARDRFGICPLFYYEDGDRLLFGSEMKSILTDAKVPRAINPRAIDQIFTFWTPIGQHTALMGVRELPPGYLLVRQGDQLRLSAYWSWPFPGQQKQSELSFSQAKEEFTERLFAAVGLRLRADVEVGSYLSGGIDSSAIVALASRLRPRELRTYSIAFKEESYDERKYQQIVADHYQTVQKTFECGDEDINDVFERVVWHTETPLFRTAPAPLNILSQHVRSDGIKVVLTGEGSDEVLLGYDIFREVKVRRFWRRQPDSRWRNQLFKRLYAYLPQFANPRFANITIESFRNTLLADSPFYSHLIRWNNNATNKAYFSDDLRSELVGYNGLEELEALMPPDYHRADDIDRAQYLELITLLRGYLLSSQGDRMTMGNSIEARFPFLDHEFVNFANSLPRNFKLVGLKDKHILRESMEALLPEEIRYRPKFAYQAPEIRAFFGVNRTRSPLVDEYLSDSIVQEAGLFRKELVSALLKKVETSGLSRLGTRDNIAFVQMLSTHIFYRKFIKNGMLFSSDQKTPKLFVKTRLRGKA